MPNTITVKDYLALPDFERPEVTYNGNKVIGAYRDPSYKDVERYVIKYEDYGVGSKKPETELVVTG